MRFNKIILTAITAGFFSCVSEKEEGVFITDDALFKLVQSSSMGFFKKNSDTLDADPESAHAQFVRVWFNPRAQSAMNDSLSILNNSVFPDESLVVKENYNAKGGTLQNYAVMYKLKGASNSGSGWIWNELKPDGSVIYSAARKGDQCISCHSAGINDDLVRTFALH